MTTLLTAPMPSVALTRVDDATRRDLLKGAGLLTVAGLVAACGGPETAGTDSTAGRRSRTFVDDTGEVEIPVRPERVVTLDPQSTEVALAVDAPVVGSTIRDPADPYSSALEGLTDGITSLGAEAEPDFEALVALRPDVIVTQPWAVEGFLDRLRPIAPMVQLDYWTDDSFIEIKWEEHLRRVADALGRADAAEQRLAELDAAVDAFRADFPGDPGGTELSLMKTRADTFIMFTPASFQGQIVERLGFARPVSQRTTETDRVELSYERLGEADGDLLLLAVEAGDADQVTQLRANPLWQQLGAVGRGDVREVDGQLWLLGGSVLAGHALIDELRTVLGL